LLEVASMPASAIDPDRCPSAEHWRIQGEYSKRLEEHGRLLAEYLNLVKVYWRLRADHSTLVAKRNRLIDEQERLEKTGAAAEHEAP
jgi:hypothetical protein